MVDRDQEIKDAMDMARKKVEAIIRSDRVSADLKKEAGLISLFIGNLNRGYKRMKPETIELRMAEMTDRSRVVWDAFVLYNKTIAHDEYQAAMGMSSIELKKETEIIHTESPKNESMKKKAEIKEGQVTLSLRGGAREGAGRKSMGVKKAVSITLPQQIWNEIDNLIRTGQVKSYSEYFRNYANPGG